MYYDDDERPESYSRNFGASGHIMNKDEARVMRRLRSKTGLSEEEIRQKKEYRVLLSTAQKSGQKKKKKNTYANLTAELRESVMKHVCQQLGLAREHPDTLDMCWVEWNERRTRYWMSSGYNQANPFRKPK
jgi:hypothetical protein